jgi:hypothetical protein
VRPGTIVLVSSLILIIILLIAFIFSLAAAGCRGASRPAGGY